MITRLRAVRDDDRGAMLIVALIVITSVALVTGVVLTHGGTNYRATATLQGVAGTSYAADTAAKVAVNNLRLGAKAPGWVTPSFPGLWSDWVYTDNADGTGCFGADGTAPKNDLELKNVYPRAGDQTAAGSARVECSTVSGTGIFGAGTGVGIEDPDPTNAFARALTTVGTTGVRQGMMLDPLGGGGGNPMPMRGGIASKSYINVTHGALVTDGYVKAEGTCTGVIVSSPEKVCNQPGSVDMPVAPPSPLTSVPTYRNPNDYSASAPVGQRCVFQPGFYNSAAALSTAVNSCTTARFVSGKYYFDFNDERHGGQNIWNITKTVVGGEYVGGIIPGTCKSPILNDPIQGVQFVFGGTSRITVSDTAHVELCGPSNGGEPPLTLYQQPTGSAETPVIVGAQPARVVEQVTGVKIDNFTIDPAGGTMQDAIAAESGSKLSWVSTKKDNQAAVDLRDFTGLSAIPVNADIVTAQVRIKYEKSVDAPSLTLDVTGTSTVAPVTVPVPDLTGWATVDLAEHLQTLIGTGLFDATRPKLELRLPAAPNLATLKVDAVSLAVTYLPPALHPATDVNFILEPSGNFKGEFVVQGATFAPKGYVDLDPGSSTSALVAFRWGLVASGVNLKAQPSQQFGYPLVSMPVAGQGLGNKVTVVDLKVFVCVEQGTCATGGTHALTVRAMITDPPYNAWGSGPPRPEPGRRKVEVLSWSEQR